MLSLTTSKLLATSLPRNIEALYLLDYVWDCGDFDGSYEWLDSVVFEPCLLMLEVKEASVPHLCEFDLLLFHLFEIYWPSDLDHEAAKPWRSSKAKILKDLGDQFGVQVEVADYRNSW